MKQVDRLLIKAKHYEDLKNPRKCAFIGMVQHSDTIGKWTAWVDIATEGDIKSNKCPYTSLERITAEAPTRAEIMEKVAEITTKYHSNTVEPVILILDWTSCTDDELREVIDTPGKYYKQR